jgi:methylenetetrahydrofolate--tRNA-(uracil-5-)-methyltransferase
LAAGQLTGTEGYTPAVAGGWLAGTNAARLAKGEIPITLPATTMLGALVQYITSAEPKHFQPMPPTFGILPELPHKIRNKVDRYRAYRDRAFKDLEQFSVFKRVLIS